MASWDSQPEIGALVGRFEERLGKPIAYEVEVYPEPFEGSLHRRDCVILFRDKWLRGVDSVELGPTGIHISFMLGKRSRDQAEALMKAAVDLGAVRDSPRPEDGS